MISAIISVIFVVLCVVFGVKLLLLIPTILLYGLVAIGLLIKFVAQKILIAVPWIIAAIVALAVGFIGLGRQFSGAGNAKYFVEKFLPPRDFERETISLTLIELMIAVHQKILKHTSQT